MSETSLEYLDDAVSDDYFFRVRQKFPRLDMKAFRTHLREVLKYLYLASQASRLPFYGCKELDLVWHELILQTQDYSELCAKLPGGRFVHHESTVPERAGVVSVDIESCTAEITFYAAYVSQFGGFTDATLELWQRAGILRLSWNLKNAEALNRRLIEILCRS